MGSSPYTLRLRGREIPLELGDFVIGRSAGCDLVLDDSLSSRRHAVLHVLADQVVLEDLGSRNGVLVNGVRMFDPATLTHGDKVVVGCTELFLVEASARKRRDDMATRPLVSSGVLARDSNPEGWDASTEMGSVYDILIAACDRALMQGDMQEAAAAVRNLLLSVRAALLRRQVPDAHTMRALTGCVLQMLDRTGDPAWLDRLFELMAAAKAVPDAATLERLGGFVRRLGPAGAASVQSFVARMDEVADLDGEAHQRLARLVGLARQVGT
jgi:pSer/pThr/pTyr-binding forkhead associated (FHA) protein